jgi:hippurate hydrolase
MGSLEEILAGYDGIQAGQEAFYKDLHEHPELSHQEHRTAEPCCSPACGPGPRP